MTKSNLTAGSSAGYFFFFTIRIVCLCNCKEFLMTNFLSKITRVNSNSCLDYYKVEATLSFALRGKILLTIYSFTPVSLSNSPLVVIKPVVLSMENLLVSPSTM